MGCLGMFVGSCALLVGLSLIVVNTMNYSKMERANGVAVKWEKGMKGAGPHVQFDVDGKDYIISGQIHVEGKGRGIKRGTTVGVLYNPTDPNKGVLDLFLDKWFTSAMVTGVGFGMATIGFFLSRPVRYATGTEA